MPRTVAQTRMCRNKPKVVPCLNCLYHSTVSILIVFGINLHMNHKSHKILARYSKGFIILYPLNCLKYTIYIILFKYFDNPNTDKYMLFCVLYYFQNLFCAFNHIIVYFYLDNEKIRNYSRLWKKIETYDIPSKPKIEEKLKKEQTILTCFVIVFYFLICLSSLGLYFDVFQVAHTQNYIFVFLYIFTYTLQNIYSFGYYLFYIMYLILLSRAICQKFNDITNWIRYRSSQNDLNLINIETCRSDYYTLCEIVEDINEVFGKSILILFSIQFVFIFAILYLLVFKNCPITLKIIIVLLSSIILIMFLLISFFAAEIPRSANLCSNTIYKSSLQFNRFKDELSIYKFLKSIDGVTIGLSGCGFFVVTTKAIFSIVGSVFSYFIILIQFQIAMQKSCKTDL